ncbi:MAG: hypothetical protein CM15mV44_0600 [uncultured marine virus]|nr:MAG: hypothetical protein CM15mV44_0600 [uncultured marine virus]
MSKLIKAVKEASISVACLLMMLQLMKMIF